MSTLTLQMDVAETRVLHDRMTVFRSGYHEGRLGFDLAQSSNIAVDAVTYTTMLEPLANRAEWQTTFTGDYARLKKADYDIAESSAWVEHHYQTNGNVYLLGLNTNAAVATLQTYPANTPFVLSWFGFSTNNVFVQLEVLLGNVGLQFWSDGLCQIYRGVSGFPFAASAVVGEGSLGQLESQSRGGETRLTRQAVGGQPIDVWVIPYRRRELLILSNRGGAFSIVFEDISDDDPAPVVTPAGPLRWRVPTGQPMVQAARMRMRTSGIALTDIIELEDAPQPGQSPSVQVYYERFADTYSVTGSVVESDGVTAFVPDGNKKLCRLRVAFSGDGTGSCWVYGVGANFAAITESTAESAVQVLAYAQDISLNVPENPAGVALSVTFRDVGALEAVVPQARRITNRPVRAKIGNVTVLDGRSEPPAWVDAPNFSGRAYTRLSQVWRDGWAGLETYRFRNALPFAGRDLKTVLTELWTLPGYAASECDIEDFGYLLPGNTRGSRGDWDLRPEDGDTAAQWIMRLLEDFAPNAICCIVPTATGRQFRVQTPEALGDTAVVSVYPKIAQAITAYILLGYSFVIARLLAVRSVYRSFREETFPPEANEIRVTGWDAALQRAYQARWREAAWQMPSTAPNARAGEWVGEAWRYMLFEPALTSEAACVYGLGKLQLRLGRSLRLGEWESDLLLKSDGSPVWRGDVVDVIGQGRYRVISLSASIGVETPDASAYVWRPTRYVGEYVGTGASAPAEYVPGEPE